MTPSDLDCDALERWLAAELPASGPLCSVKKFPGGQSNPTYRVDCDAASFVLRRKPSGPLLPSAHAIDREYRLLGALHPRGFPVPGPVRYCENDAVIGTPFYLMTMVEGLGFANGQLPDVPLKDRGTIYRRCVETLAELHLFDPDEIGLGDFGRSGNYFVRQIGRWTKQYRASQTDDISEIERLIEWLPRSIPVDGRRAIIHGDYRIDNLIFRPDGQGIAAVLDWELATIGDPIADISYFLMHWILPADGGAALGGVELDAQGIPSFDELLDLYLAQTGAAAIGSLHWYFAYNLFRLIAIVQGVKKRMIEGHASSLQAEQTANRVRPLARAAWEQAILAGAPLVGSSIRPTEPACGVNRS